MRNAWHGWPTSPSYHRLIGGVRGGQGFNEKDRTRDKMKRGRYIKGLVSELDVFRSVINIRWPGAARAVQLAAVACGCRFGSSLGPGLNLAPAVGRERSGAARRKRDRQQQQRGLQTRPAPLPGPDYLNLDDRLSPSECVYFLCGQIAFRARKQVAHLSPSPRRPPAHQPQPSGGELVLNHH
ncbi:hypothetical protein LSTR_LSTR006380 [Laodelphax striatellus]|uniref:Uncharacterized protein n=1 Tax=Laodelphax striatellus TaxID=195883 RepID=A0A482XEG8_LAOST|nr:hypothetical protein LSTR_LSTR006380 [Laodelphax striatellus]